MKSNFNLHLSMHQGERQWESPDVTSEAEYATNKEYKITNNIHIKPLMKFNPKNTNIYQEISQGKYVLLCRENDDFDSYFYWLIDRLVYGISTPYANLDLLLQLDDELDYSFDDSMVQRHVSKDHCLALNIGTINQPKIVHINSHLSQPKIELWLTFFKADVSTFAWTFQDLCGLLAQICKHHMNLEDNIRHVRQRQH